MHKKFQMSSMGELTFFLGLQVTQKDDGIFISQDNYVNEILKKFGFSTVKTASTPMETSKPLLKDAEAEDVDVHLYRSMIGSLMYLTSSRPDIMFDDSPFDLEAYYDSDYAGASLDRKSTTGGCQFLGSRLISWQCKKQTIVANSTTKAEYVVATSCCGQATSKAKTVNGEVLIQALVDGKKVIVTEMSVRRPLQLKDTEVLRLLLGMNLVALWPQLSSIVPQTKDSTFPMFLDKQVEGMTKHKEIYVTPSHTKKVFANMKRGGKGFSGRVTPLFQTMMVQAQEEGKEPIIDEAANEEHVPIHSNDPLLSGEDRLKLNELMELCTNLSQRVLDLENTKTSQAVEIAKLKKRVKKLERRNKSRTPGLKRLRKVGRTAKIESSEDEEIKAAKPKAITTTATTTTAADTRPKARGVVVQEPNEEIAQRLQEELQAELEEEERLARQKEEEDNLISWDNTQAMMELMDKRKKHFAKLRVEEIRRKPPTKAQKRNQMCTYLKNIANYKHSHLKNKSFEEIQMLFDNTIKWVDSFVPMDSEVVEGSKSQAEGNKKRTREELESDNSKKKKIDENAEDEVDDEAEMKKLIEIVPDDKVAIDAIPLATKSLIIVD
ncbi:retrovirus-related pol polyprotein from transposon TNT 1-94 [Tanacetum coccineum]